MITQHAPPGDQITMAGSLNGLYLLAHAHALSFTVFIRKDFGSEGIGICGLGTILMILGWGAYANCLAMFGFFGLWLLAVIVQRIRTFGNWRKGVIIHSRYNGYPPRCGVSPVRAGRTQGVGVPGDELSH